MSELAYKFTGAGHEMPEERRKYDKQDDRLSKAFEEWMEKRDDTEEKYELATELINGIEATVEHAHALLLRNQDHPNIEDAGFFISAIYNKTQDKVIVYDLDIPIHALAYKLEGKTFINKGTTGQYMGWQSTGNIINNGTTWRAMGKDTTGNVINNGKTGDHMGSWTKGNVINNGTTDDSLGWMAEGNIINNGTTGSRLGGARGLINLINVPGVETTNMPELKQYLDSLKLQLTNPNMDEVLRVLEGLTKESLDKDIANILMRAKWQQH